MPTPSSDKAAIRQVIRALVNDGYELVRVDNREEFISVTNESEAIEAITEVDEAALYVKYGNHNTTHWVYFVLDNVPYVVVGDYSESLSHVINPLIDSWWED